MIIPPAAESVGSSVIRSIQGLFDRGSFHTAFDEVGGRLVNDLLSNYIPLPIGAT